MNKMTTVICVLYKDNRLQTIEMSPQSAVRERSLISSYSVPVAAGAQCELMCFLPLLAG